MGTNVRFRWDYSPGSELLVVYNDQRDTTLRPGRLPMLENRRVHRQVHEAVQILTNRALSGA